MADLLSELLERCKRDDREAIRVLVERFSPAAHDLAAAILQDRHLAEDAVQAAFVVALTRLAQLKEPDAFAAWLRQIVRTQCNRILRRRHEHASLISDDASAACSPPDENLQKRELCDMVRQALARISPLGRQTAELFYFEDHSLVEVARILQVPEGTVKRRLHDVRAQLRNILLGYMVDAPEDPKPPASPDEGLPL